MSKALLYLVWEILIYPLTLIALLIVGVMTVGFGFVVLFGVSLCWAFRKCARWTTK